MANLRLLLGRDWLRARGLAGPKKGFAVCCMYKAALEGMIEC